MLQVDDDAQIRLAHRDGMIVREIARKFGHSRRKIREVLAHAVLLPYTLTTPREAPKLGLFPAAIDEILRIDETQPVKQRHTAACIFRRLKDEQGYLGG
jgi:transposase